MNDEDVSCPTPHDVVRFLLSFEDTALERMHAEEEGFLYGDGFD